MDKTAGIQTVGIAGLGLIGGSVALALRGRYTVVGADPDERTAEYCLRNGIVSRMSALEGLSVCDVVFVCVPLSLVRPTVERLYEIVGDGAIITDAGSVKGNLRGLKGRLVGGHPMAGREHGGVTAARAHLMENAYYCLVPYENTSPEDVAAVREIVRGCFKARPVVLSAEEHDAVAARLSHLPHTVAYALSASALKEDPAENAVAGTGFADATRIARSDPEFWTEVARLNRENLLGEMRRFREAFTRLEETVAREDWPAVTDFFASAKEKRDKLTLRRAYRSEYTVEVDVRDEVGAVGRIGTLLAQAGVNLSNIQIVHSREGACGALRIEIEDEAGYERAKKLLERETDENRNKNGRTRTDT